MLPRAFRLDGIADRREAWIATLATYGMLFGINLSLPMIRQSGAEPLAFAVLGLMVVWLIATLMRRLHDIGKSGLWVLLCAIPLIGLVWQVIILCRSSDAPYPSRGGARTRIAGAALFAMFALVVLRGFFMPYSIPSTSMAPTLTPGDYVLVRGVGWDPRRGDVIVFRDAHRDVDFVERLIGLPGERIAIRDGIPVIDGTPLVQTPAGNYALPMGQQVQRLTETLPDGRTYTVLNIRNDAPGDQIPEIVVPDGHYFVLGDHRDNSADSRWPADAGGLGMVPANTLIGQADMVLFSAGGSGQDALSWRADRFLIAVE